MTKQIIVIQFLVSAQMAKHRYQGPNFGQFVDCKIIMDCLDERDLLTTKESGYGANGKQIIGVPILVPTKLLVKNLKDEVEDN